MKGDADLARRLVAQGLDGEAVRAALALEGVIQRWRRLAMRRLPERRAIEALGLDLDVARLDVLTAILAPEVGFEDGTGEEPMVATVAARLGIDPSRASRLVADVIASGHARRAVSQRDARRAIVELTESGAQGRYGSARHQGRDAGRVPRGLDAGRDRDLPPPPRTLQHLERRNANGVRQDRARSRRVGLTEPQRRELRPRLTTLAPSYA